MLGGVYRAKKRTEIMLNKYLIPKLFLLFTFMLLGFKVAEPGKVKGWYISGASPANYEIGIENSAERGGKVAYLKSIKSGGNFGTIMQTFFPEAFLDKRVRLTGFIKSENINDWAGMWFRVDGEDKKMLSFNNMQNRPIEGTTNWTKYEIVLDVPQKSKAIAYGVLICGEGKVWIDDLEFEVVDKSVRVSEMGPVKKNGSGQQNKPVNNHFEETE